MPLTDKPYKRALLLITAPIWGTSWLLFICLRPFVMAFTITIYSPIEYICLGHNRWCSHMTDKYLSPLPYKHDDHIPTGRPPT